MTTATESCWTTGYWLRNCEGFRVETGDGDYGFVETVELAAGGEASALIVRIGESSRDTRVPVHAVAAIDAGDELVTLRPLARGRPGLRRQRRESAPV